jgi:hypothetical protein
MALQTELFGASDAIRNEDLAHIMRFSRRDVALDYVLEFACKDLSIRVACETGSRCIGRQHNDDWP